MVVPSASTYNIIQRDQKDGTNSSSIYKTEQKRDGTSNGLLSTDSPSNRSPKNVNTYTDSLKSNPTYTEKDLDKINLLLGKTVNLWDKKSIGSINEKAKRHFATINKKLEKLKWSNKELNDILLSQIQ